MELFLLAAVIISSFHRPSAGAQNQCGCIDRSWCNKQEPKQKLDCPLSFSLCTALPVADGEPGRLVSFLVDQAIAGVSTECKDGWSVASLKSTTNGFPNPMVSVVQNNLTDGNEHTIFIDGYNGKYPARFIFKSKDSDADIPLFMTMYLWEKYIAMNEKKDGQWCSNNVRVYNRVNWETWRMQFKVRMSGGNQQFDILFLNDKYDTIYRFYPQTHITKGDWFIFYEDYHYILGITWSRSTRHVQFKRTPSPGSRIAIRGQLRDMDQFNIMINNEAGRTKMVINGILGVFLGDFGFISDQNTVGGYGTSVSCSSAYFCAGNEVLIVIEVMRRGIKYYAQGWHLCTFESDKFNLNDVSQIDVNGALNILGYGANTCDYYRY